MKCSFVCLFYLISTIFADRKFFELPVQNSVYNRGDIIKFIANDVSHDDDVTIQVTLHQALDNKVALSLGNFTGKSISYSGDDFIFTWPVNVPNGQYYVEINELDDDDDSDDDDNDNDNDNNDNSNRSFNFEVSTWPYATPMYIQHQKRRKNKV